MTSSTKANWAFFTALGVTAVLSLVLPDRLQLPQATVERWMMLAFLPFCLYAVYALRTKETADESGEMDR